ncbi:MAG: LysM peptidoglycan-binding domain-containing protein [Verrucomicrobiales bacterium]
MKHLLLLTFGVLGFTSCESLKFGKSKPEPAANPYEVADEGGWGSSQGFAQTGSVPTDGGADYNQVYNDAANWHDEVNVVPFTDNGSDRPTQRQKSNAAASKRTADKKVASSKASSSKNKSGAAAKKSAGLASSSRATSGSSTGKKPAQATARSSQRTHIVKRGDTLYDIGRSYRVSVDNLKRRNQLDSDLIRVGAELAID